MSAPSHALSNSRWTHAAASTLFCALSDSRFSTGWTGCAKRNMSSLIWRAASPPSSRIVPASRPGSIALSKIARPCIFTSRCRRPTSPINLSCASSSKKWLRVPRPRHKLKTIQKRQFGGRSGFLLNLRHFWVTALATLHQPNIATVYGIEHRGSRTMPAATSRPCT